MCLFYQYISLVPHDQRLYLQVFIVVFDYCDLCSAEEDCINSNEGTKTCVCKSGYKRDPSTQLCVGMLVYIFILEIKTLVCMYVLLNVVIQ